MVEVPSEYAPLTDLITEAIKNREPMLTHEGAMGDAEYIVASLIENGYAPVPDPCGFAHGTDVECERNAVLGETYCRKHLEGNDLD